MWHGFVDRQGNRQRAEKIDDASRPSAVTAVLVLRIGFGRRVVLSLSEEGRRQLWLWGGALFLANWLYVITWVG